MAEAGRQYRNVDRCAELLCCFCASVEEGKGRTGGTGKTFGTASDGLSSSASEIYTSDSGRNDSEAGISEDGSRLYENKTGKGRFAYEAIVTACHEMDSGVSELEAYRRFGEHCDLMKYKTFSTILIQNLQKGSQRMADLLEKEALEAWDERKRKARVLGEAAATKLLVPMVMMLVVVMAIIMIPAFLSFYGQ